MKRGRVALMGVLALWWMAAAPGCAGTNTGNPTCPAFDWCETKSRVTGPGHRTWGALIALTGAQPPAIEIRGGSVAMSGSACTNGDRIETSAEEMDVVLTWKQMHGSADPDGTLHVRFDYPLIDPTGASPDEDRGTVHFGRGDPPLGVLKADLTVTRGGELSGSLVTIPFNSITAAAIAAGDPIDAGLPDGGTIEQEVRIEGPVSVDCQGRSGTLAVPVGSGPEAQIRCELISEPAGACRDTVASCSMRRLTSRP